MRPSDADFAYAATMVGSDDPGLGGAEPAADWCLDLGERLITLSTFDAWSAIARGEVRGLTLAWREGLECWTPVEELDELACALTAEPTPEPVATDIYSLDAPNSPDSLSAFELEEPTAIELRAPLLPSKKIRPVLRLGRFVGRPALIGAVFAAAAILAAAFRPAPATATAAPRTPEAQRAGLAMIAARMTDAALTAAVAQNPAEEPPAAHPPTASRRADKGQRRLRRSGR